ncbi:MAG: MaoC family dehydratase [Bradymonadaceae bacterium]
MTATMEFHGLPTLGVEYVRALSRITRPAFEGAMPDIEAIAHKVSIDPDRLADYSSVCGLPSRATLPATYPQVLATPLHGAILASADFPFGPLGLVHRGNRIVQHGPIELNADLDLRARIGSAREVSRGIEFDLETFADVEHECVWESTTTILVRRRKDKGPASKKSAARIPKPGETPERTRSIILRIPEDTGRRYARASGDFNPIHLHTLLARPFGFRRAIVQGMWSLARCFGELIDDLPAAPYEIDVLFERPINLPSSVLFSSGFVDEGLEFAVKKDDGSKVYLRGSISARR